MNAQSQQPPTEPLTSLPGYRSPPHNYEAEKALLGAIFANNRVLDRISDLRSEHFADPVHGRIYDVCSQLVAAGGLANPITLKTRFEGDEMLDQVGGPKYLAELAGAAVTIINAVEYARILIDLHVRRAMINVAEVILDSAYGGDEEDMSATAQIEMAEAKLARLGDGENADRAMDMNGVMRVTVAAVDEAYRNQGQVVGVTTGLRDLDSLLGGLRGGNLYVVAGRPGMGKTALAGTMLAKSARVEMVNAEADKRKAKIALFLSLEMPTAEIGSRLLADAAGIDGDKIRDGNLGHDELDALVRVSADLKRLPIHIDDTPRLTMAGVRARARRAHRRFGLRLLAIDYLGLMKAIDERANKVHQIGDMVNDAKSLAKELGIPVVLLSQLSRGVEQREDKRPMLSDLRDSGEIEQAADVVIFIFREQYYLERAEPRQRADEGGEKFEERYQRWTDRASKVHNQADLIVAKNRHGRVGSVNVFCDMRYSRLGDFTRGYD